MIVETESGSRYEIDGLRARRLFGKKDPTARLGEDGAWRDLEQEPVVRLGLPLVLLWTSAIQPAAAEGCVPGTITSRVVKIVGVEA